LKPSILIVGVGEADKLDLELVSEAIFKEFHGQMVPVLEFKPLPVPSDAYDPTRTQYLAPSLLLPVESLRRRANHNFGLGVTLLDLYVDGLNFIFGEASDRAAILSTHRLRIGLAVNSGRYAKRVSVVAKHEVGHMLGLSHCSDPRCSMRFHNSILEVDLGSGSFCQRCRWRIDEALEAQAGKDRDC